MKSGAQALRRVSNAVKRIVAYRYEYKCAEPSCRVVLPPTWECDHIVPLWKIVQDPDIWTKDPNHLANLQPLCPSCHRNKTLKETLEQERFRLADRYDAVYEAGYGHDGLSLDEMLQIQEVEEECEEKEAARTGGRPAYYDCHKCNVRYSPYFTHKCKIPDVQSHLSQFAFDPDKTSM